MRIIQLTKRQICSLVDETRKKYPVETCGLLFGEENGEEVVVRKIVAVDNVLKSSTNFQINPEELVKHLTEAENEGLQLIGFFHSHPAPPHPSITDIEYMELWPESIWLIISSIDYSIGACQIVNSEARKVNIEVI